MPDLLMPESRPVSDSRQLVVEACHEPWSDAWSRLQERFSTVIAPLREGLARHREAVTAAGLEGAAPSEWSDRSERLLEYRRAVGSALLEPLARVLQDAGPAAQITDAFADALERANTATRTLPVRVDAPWPVGALDAQPSDGPGRRIGKAFGRFLSSARKAGQQRPLPLRDVGTAYLREDVAEAQDEAIAEALSAWAAWGGRLERVWLDWADSALPAMVQAELPDDEQALEIWAAVRDAAATLQSRLEALAGASPHAAAAAESSAMLEACGRALEADLAVAGSFLLPGRSGPPARLEHVGKVAPSYASWDREIGGRLQLYVSILSILAGAGAVQRRVVYRCREGSLGNADDLTSVADSLRELVPALRRPEARQRSREAISELDRRVTAVLQPALRAIPEPAQLAATFSEAADSAVEALLAVIRQSPPSLVLHAFEQPPPDGKRRKRLESRSIPVQELARQSFDALRIERIRASTDGLLTTIGGVVDDLEGLPGVFTFARDEALRELDSPEAGASEQAFDLLEDALERMASALETRVDDLDKALHAAHARLADELVDGSQGLLGRVGAGRMQAQLFAARSRAADLVARLTDAWGPRLRRAFEWARSAVRSVSAWLAATRDRGRAFLGRESAAELASSRTLQSLAEVQAFVEGLPLVYQRLFTLEPVTDPAMLAGRSVELEGAVERWRRWQTDRGIPILVRGRQRSGITSFLRVFASRVQGEGGTCLSLGLDARIDCEAELAELLSKKLGLRPAGSLDELAHAVFAADESALPGVVTLDNLEHAYLRVPKGTDLAERLLTLMAETEPRILWVGGINSSAWQLISTAEPTAVSQLDVLDLPSLGGPAVHSAILARHRRSGLDVHYEESITTSARIRRRLRAMRDGKGFRQLLEDEFFEQLHRASGGYLGLSLYLWLQSASFDPDEGVVMSLPKRPDFSILEQLSLTQNFTLKAFLEHRTLTLAEHDRIFRLPRHESYQILESLRNRQLIVAAGQDVEDVSERSEIEVDLRYRVRPLLTGAVIGHLQARNIVH